jgi:hypothetical protein
VAPDDLAVTVDDEGRRAGDVALDAAVRVQQTEGAGRFEVRVRQQPELDAVVVCRFASRILVVAADRDDLGVRSLKLVDA